MALHFGHRTSYDLDFFAAEHFSIDRVLKTLADLGHVDSIQATEDTFNGRLNGFRISFFIYPYPITVKSYFEKEVGQLYRSRPASI